MNKKYYLKKEYSYITFPQNSDNFLAPLWKKKYATSAELYTQLSTKRFIYRKK